MERITISDLAKAAGLSPKTIRFYEEKGLLPKPHRSEGGYRLYESDDVARLTFIRRVRALGFTLSETARLTRTAEHTSCESFQEPLHTEVARKLIEMDELIEELVQKREALAGLSNCLTDSITSTSNANSGDCQQPALDCYATGAWLGARQPSTEGRCVTCC